MTNRKSAMSFDDITSCDWDLLVIGGGITGAGIFREATARGLRTLLVEQDDFASGTSSKSSKLVHGGLHYLMRRQMRLAFHSIRERDRLLREERGLVEPLEMVIPRFPGDRLPEWFVSAGLDLYDALGGRVRHHRVLTAGETSAAVPGLTGRAAGGFRYADACTDDVRLVLKVIRQGAAQGGVALNYTVVEQLLARSNGRISAAALRHKPSGLSIEVTARAIVNATGPWAERLLSRNGHPPRVRLVRGSHLVFTNERLPCARGVMTMHPKTRQPFYVLPWEGCALVGSTSVEHRESPSTEPRISQDEAEYLLHGVQALFPDLELTGTDVLATFSGLRPIVDTETADPARASRDTGLWEDHGLITVAGGKLTTFHLTAVHVLDRLSHSHQAPQNGSHSSFPSSGHVAALSDFSPGDLAARRLIGRYGRNGAAEIAQMAAHGSKSDSLWAELRWIARNEQVVHLDDLLLRRVRIGLTDPGWVDRFAEPMREIARSELGWEDCRWEAEHTRFHTLWRGSYQPCFLN